ncbi:MAG: RagB/SusD family nutrient uptake outer membrane protein [Bacteroidales bacterium]|nr:RagB/SusD family nutrient uptake outer membrane protein [Bacteroidales bacterium]
MKRSNLHIPILLLVIFLLSSCEDFLTRGPIDTIPAGEYFQTSEGIQYAANAIYAPLGEEGFNGKSYWMIGDGASDDAQPNGEDPDYIPIDQFSLASDNARNADLWQILYRMIALANIVLENSDPAINDAPQAVLDRVRGEALGLRAYGYFVLVRLYSDVPLIVDGMAPEELINPVRTSAYEVYLQIIEDLETASDLLPAKSDYTGDDIGRINKHATKSILAQVYMTIAGDLSMYNTESFPDNSDNIASIANAQTCYQNALELCDEVINSGDYRLLPDFADLWTREGDNCDESVWQLQMLGKGTRHGSGNMRQAFWAPWQSEITGAGDGWGSHSPHEDLVRCFYDNPDDLIISGNTVDTNVLPPSDLRFRETIMFPGVEYPELPVVATGEPYALPYSYGASGFACRKYVIGAGEDVGSMSAPNNVYLVRYAELFLMKAECIVELNGSMTEAAAALDGIRTRAGKPLIEAGLDQASMRAIVRLERRRELALEQKRWFDILRWGIAYDVLETQDIALDPERRLFPIPGTEIALNKNLVQNTSY